MRRPLALVVALTASQARADDAASLPPAVSFTSVAASDPNTAPATVSPSPLGDSSSSSSSPPPFRLVLSSSSSSDANDRVELVRTGAADRIAFEPMDKTTWAIDKWQNPLTLLSNMIVNDRIPVTGDSVRIGVELTDAATATSVSFVKTDAWRYGPTLVFGDHALDGLSRLKQLAFSKFNVSFDGSKWLAPDTTLKSLVFNQSTIASFALDKLYTVLRTEFHNSVLTTFPTALLHQATLPDALTINSCTFTEPFKLSAADLATLQSLPSVTFSQNTFPAATASDCVQTVAYQGASICLTTAPSNQATASTPIQPIESPEPAVGNTPSSANLDTLPPVAPLSDRKVSSSRSMLHTLVGVLGIVGGIALVAGFVYLRRRQSPPHGDDLSPSTRSDKFLDGSHHSDDNDHDVEHGTVRGMAYSQRTTTVGMGFLSDVDLGRHAVKGERRLGIHKLWRADYRGETVVALLVNIQSLRDSDRDVEAVVASCVALRHPHIVEFLGTSLSTSDEMWLVAESIAKGSLRSVLFKQKLVFTSDKIARAGRQLASALAFVQSFRDSEARVTPTLSSRSVMCDADLNCKLDIFEFAQSTRDSATPVLTYGQGEIAYRAPELLQTANAVALARDDAAAAEIYALGVILCEMTFQSPLYTEILDSHGTAIGEIMIARDVAAGRLRPAPAADAPHELARIIDACVAYEPTERPTAAQVVDRLSELTTSDDSY